MTILEDYVKIKRQIKELEAVAKEMETDVKAELQGKEEVGEFVLQKKSRITYKVKEGVDIGDISTKYPTAVSTKVDAKELYKIAVNPEELVDEKVTEYLEVKQNKKKGDDDIDF